VPDRAPHLDVHRLPAVGVAGALARLPVQLLGEDADLDELAYIDTLPSGVRFAK
jgi:hypothetical protein